MRTDSLRNRLLRRLLWPLLIMLALGEVLAYVLAQRIAMDTYDLNVLDDALDLARQVHEVDGRLLLDLPKVARQMLQSNNGDRVAYAVLDENLALIAGERWLAPHAPSEFPETKTLNDIQFDGEAWRRILLRTPVGQHDVLIVVAETQRNRRALMTRFIVSVALLGALLLAGAIAIVRGGVRRGLRPLDALQEQLASRSANDLRPLATIDAPAELQVIMDATNALLERLSISFSEYRRFIANASHQLRTPLAALSSQIEVNLADPPEDISAILRDLLKTTHRTVHLANQFLSLARLEHTESAKAGIANVDLTAVIREVTSNFLLAIERKQVELLFELDPATVQGNAMLLGEMLSNLLDNAIRYVFNGGTVRVTLTQTNSTVSLKIADDGPGVDRSLWPKLGVPFYRLTTNEPDSSGLGLAIVMEIARLHRAHVSFGAGLGDAGFGVTIDFAIPIAS